MSSLRMTAVMLTISLNLAGCDKIGPMRDHHPENKVHSPSSPSYQPPLDEKPILNIRTGEPRRPGEPSE